jgi:hypothetical protein
MSMQRGDREDRIEEAAEAVVETFQSSASEPRMTAAVNQLEQALAAPEDDEED